MYLKKLTMQAFGPFKERVVIDFEDKKINKGLLLITGDTGAGKTTIFDAICYALYGKTSGDTRGGSSLRSDWASSDIDTFVELEFYYKNKLYDIRRSPEYTRVSKNGTKMVKKVATASANIDDKILTKLTDVNKEIEKLIGLDYNQFRQVAMLSQGEFTRFLLANSEEKTTIFRKIFNTEFYDNLQNKLKSDMILKKEIHEKIKSKIDVERINLNTIIEISDISNNNILEVLDNKIKEKTNEVFCFKKTRDEVMKEKTDLITEISNINKLNNDIIVYQTSCKRIDELKRTNPNIELDREKYNYNINIALNITNVLDNLSLANKSLEDKKNKYFQNNKDLELRKKEYGNKRLDFKKIENYSKNVDMLNEDINVLTNKIKEYDEYLNKINELNVIERDYKSLCEEYYNKVNLYEIARSKYYLNISVEIAEHLSEGEACPVCGSVDHPKIATANYLDYTKDYLEELEKELNKLDSLRKGKEALIEQVRSFIKKLGISDEVNVYDEKIKSNNLLEKKRREKLLLDNEFEKITLERERLLSEIKSLEDNNVIFISDIKKIESDIKRYNKSLNDMYVSYNTNYDDYINKKIDRFELSSLKEKIDNYDNNLIELELNIKRLDEEVRGREVIDLTERRNRLNELINDYNKYDDLYMKINVVLEKLKTSRSNIKVYLKEEKESREEFGIVKILSDTASGALVGKKRVTFENYVQSYYMRSVLIEANKRLVKMTDGRYELKRKVGDVKLNTKTGLDFSVFDCYTGRERDVASLSGGEKFKASLSLALGLSDTISNNSGGIRINSLFIDEGFGSLDTESLNQALDILTELSFSDKLIGVISHVTELIGRIDNKIVVNKTNTGSNLIIKS